MLFQADLGTEPLQGQFDATMIGQALTNLISDWNKDPSELAEKDVIDQEELEAIKKSVGAS